MAIKLTYRDVDNRLFVQAISKLTRYNFKNFAVAYNALKIWRKLKNELDISQDLYVKFLKRTCKLDDKGEFVLDKNPDGSDVPGSVSPIDKVDFDKQREEYLKTSFELPCHQVKMRQLEECALSAMELDTLVGNVIDDSDMADAD